LCHAEASNLQILREELWLARFIQSAKWESFYTQHGQPFDDSGGYVSVHTGNGVVEEGVELDALLNGKSPVYSFGAELTSSLFASRQVHA
jgi:hypothetical protein